MTAMQREAPSYELIYSESLRVRLCTPPPQAVTKLSLVIFGVGTRQMTADDWDDASRLSPSCSSWTPGRIAGAYI